MPAFSDRLVLHWVAFLQYLAVFRFVEDCGREKGRNRQYVAEGE
ncbi:hypothetical protein Asphe3_30010 [Pseudarthrobacter phenanthrenivorans Sphe3]|uniref:Uncharacterized protein n=1 Tax=Pseudarthrobacter phenanthrenivorans (strain DSM 18606 / JCM 16027 / LMG 23796 / Sphe3) TaxID=930171 RepID=F0MBX1_PSEPM|nr:hypothetical protein Asphe3_30010 [Pseudarthrobacter phenanthrenivorans Sphe3]